MAKFLTLKMRGALVLSISLVLVGFLLNGWVFKHSVVGQNKLETANKKAKQDDEYDQAVKTFRKGRQLLIDFGLPFEPNELLRIDSTNRNKILGKLLSIPDFSTSRLTENTIYGVKIADTLYLPEKVELTGDTVLIARSIIFEGKDIEVRGNFDLHMFPFERTGVLGSTLGQALSKSRTTFKKVAFNESANLNFSTVKLPLVDKPRIKIDLHGLGREDWLKKQKTLPARENRNSDVKFVFASYAYDADPIFPQTQGEPGSTGQNGGPGPGGVGGNNGSTGTGGNCSSGINGGDGTASSTGVAPTEPGGIGGTGGDGTPGGSFSAYVNDGDTANYTISTYGGAGGDGGIGGTGGQGGAGGRGGDGGPGASCKCQVGLGNGGAGSNGSHGGPGGTGGKGGKGGNGKNGGNVNVSVPNDYDVQAHLTFNRQPGLGGRGGLGGSQGVGGSFGAKGRGGSPGTNPSCSPSGGNYGPDGTDGDFGPLGGSGAVGDPGAPGTEWGVVTIDRRPGPGGGDCLSPLDCCPCGDCVNGCDDPPDPTCHLESYLECTEVCVLDDYGEPEDCETECYEIYYWVCD